MFIKADMTTAEITKTVVEDMQKYHRPQVSVDTELRTKAEHSYNSRKEDH